VCSFDFTSRFFRPCKNRPAPLHSNEPLIVEESRLPDRHSVCRQDAEAEQSPATSSSTDHQRCSKEDEPIVTLGSPGMSMPNIILLNESWVVSCTAFCPTISSFPFILQFSHVPPCLWHALHILTPITLLVLLLPPTCCTVRIESRYFTLTQFSQHLNLCVLCATKSKRPHNI